MDTKEIVKKIVGYINAGKNVEAEEELYADDVLSVEQSGYSAQGKAAIIEKTKGAAASWTMHDVKVTKAFAGKDCFLLEITMDAEPKDGSGRKTVTEYGFYKVKDGKVSEEYFFAEPLS